MTNFQTRNLTSPRQFGFFCISGGSGTGKTRTSYELPSLFRPILKSKKWKEISLHIVVEPALIPAEIESASTHLDVSNESASSVHPFSKSHRTEKTNIQSFTPSLFDSGSSKAIQAEQWLRRLLCRPYGVAASVADTLSLKEILDEIRKTVFPTEDVKKRSLMILFLHLDEFQSAIEQISSLCRLIGRLLVAKQENAFVDNNVLILPILSGTWTGSLTLASEYVLSSIVLAGFDSLRDAEVFYESAFNFERQLRSSSSSQSSSISPTTSATSSSSSQSSDPSYVEDASSASSATLAHRHILAMLGFIPRMIQIYARYMNGDTLHCSDLSRSEQFEPIWQELRVEIGQAYPTSHHDPFVLRHLLVLWYFKIPISSNYRLNGVRVKDLEGASIFFLQNSTNAKEKTSKQRSGGSEPAVIAIEDTPLTISLPFVYVCEWMPTIFNQSSFVKPWGQVDESTLPKFCALIHTCTFQMLDEWCKVELELKRPICSDLLSMVSSSKPPALRVRNKKGFIRTSLREIYANSVLGPASLLDKELWIHPRTKILDRPSTKEEMAALVERAKKESIIFETISRTCGPDLLAPHGAEQYKASDSFAHHYQVRGGKPITGTVLFDELEGKPNTKKKPNMFGHPFLAVITPKTVTGFEVTKDGPIILHVSEGGQRAKTPQFDYVADNLLLIHTTKSFSNFCRGLDHASMLYELQADTGSSSQDPTLAPFVSSSRHSNRFLPIDS